MAEFQDPIESIVFNLKNKSSIKQQTYKHLCAAFAQLIKSGKLLIEEVLKRSKGLDSEITISFKKVSDQEFHLKVAGDLIIFVSHTNIITFEETYGVIKSEYVQQDKNRGYFGQIMIYNFMADSVKYNRLSDPGYLLGRLFVNYENHFFMEGEGQFDFMFNEPKILEHIDLDIIVKLAVDTAAKSDLFSPPYNEVKFITLNDKLSSSPSLGAGRKIGFQMSYKDEVS